MDRGIAAFSDGPGGDEDLRRKLEQNKAPSTAASTSRWTNTDLWADRMGQAFDATRIPLTKLEQMRRDSMIAFGLMFIKVFLARAPWYIKSESAERAAYIDGSLRRIYARYILGRFNCLDYGYAGLVKNFERVDPAEVAGWVYEDDQGKPQKAWSSSIRPLIWKPFTSLNPRRISPAFDQAGNFAGIYLRPNTVAFPFAPTSGKQPDVPLDWALWAVNEKDSVFGSLWGYPRTGYAYRYWWSYWYRFGLADRAFEKWADPPMVVYHPVDIAQDDDGNVRDFAQEGLALAEKARSGANISLPSTVVEGMADGRPTSVREWQIDQLKTEVNFDALRESFEYLDIAKLRSMMVPEQAFLEGKGGTSSRNVASTLGDVFEEGQALLMSEADDELNRYVIPQLLEANFGPGGPTCEKVTTGFDAQDVETARAVVQAFAQNDPSRLSAINFKKLLERLGVPVLGWQAQQTQAEEMAQAAARQGPPNARPGGGNAGVRGGRYFEDPERERIELSDIDAMAEEGEGDGLLEKIKGLFKRQKAEPIEIEQPIVIKPVLMSGEDLEDGDPS